MPVSDIFKKIAKFYIKKRNSYRVKITLCKDRIVKSKLITFIKEKVIIQIKYWIIYGTLLNYILWSLLGIKFTIFTIFGWGILCFFVKVEILDYLFDKLRRLKA